MLVKSVIIYSIFIFSSLSKANVCLSWFLQSGLAPKLESCEIKCSVTSVDMSTFSCSSLCSELCSKTVAEQLLAYAPRLTEGDKVVIAKMPYEAYKAFRAKEKVDKMTTQIFKTPGRGDETDAFRHFVWSTLLAQELGVEKAKIFLNGHEEDSTQSKKEKDLFNNKQGLVFFSNSKKKKIEINLALIEREALAQLRQKKLKVIKSNFSQIPRGYYSK